MDSDQQTTPIVEAWLKATSDTPYGTEMGEGRVKSRVRQIQQRGRWWPLPSIHRTPAPAPDIPTSEFPPIPTTSGHTPTATGRTMPMFSATKFVVAGVIVALFGGFLLIAQPFEQQGVRVPGAATGGPGAFSAAGKLDTGRVGHTATLLPDGRVLIIGGWGGEDSRSSAELWDPETGSFSPAGSLAQSRHHDAGHTATLLSDGRVLVVGGFDKDAAGLQSAEVWDPETASFSPAGTLAEGRASHTATRLPDGRVLVVGGYRRFQHYAQTAEVWDPETASFGPVDLLAASRLYHTATLLPDGRVLIVAGDRGENVERVTDPPAEVWDPVTASSSPAGVLAEGRMQHTATLLPDGRVLIVGGQWLPGYRRTTVAEVWDPVTASFGPGGSPLVEGRRGHSATLLPDGRVLVVGGDSGYNEKFRDHASSEVWDQVTATFSPAGSLAERRTSHTATLLPDGRVLVVGGSGGAGGELLASEIWDPSDG